MNRRPARRAHGAALAVLASAAGLVLLTLAGCSMPAQAPTASSSPSSTASPAETDGSADPTPAPPVVVDGVGLQILQNRPDYGNRVLQLSVTNEGTESLVVESARFTSAQFAGPADWVKPTEVPAGLTRHLPVQLADAVCPAPTATATMVLTVTDASGAVREIIGTPSDPFAVLPRIAGEDCLDEAVAAVAELRLDDHLEVTGTGSDSVAHLRLLADPSEGTGTLTLDEARSTVLLEPAEGDTWPLGATLEGGGPAQSFVLDAVPARCDPHAVAEDKRGTFLPVSVGVDGGTSGTVSLRSSDALRLALYDFIAAHCGFATG